MVDAPSTAMLATVVNDAMALDFELPDPEDDSISPFDFGQAIERAWEVCDRFDLQTEIWRGRILRTVRDRERYGGDERGAGFLAWLKEREITKSRAYNLIELASSADALLEQGSIELDSVTQFSKQAFIEMAQSPPEVQVLIGDAARDGKRITKNHVKQVAEEWTAVTSALLPEPIRAKAADNSLPSKYLAPLVKEMEKLPEQHQEAIQAEMADNPDLATVKDMTLSARYLSRYLESAAQVQTINQGAMNLELALEESLRLDCLNLTADLVHQAAQLENAMAKLYTSWKRLGSLSDRLYVESGASTPHLRQLLDVLGAISGDSLSLPMGELATGRTIRIQILPEE
ncbi:MAG: hypothetical protein HC824_09745 [Synechococcales cyanobacterium RM1_1_8]|nr:hypothetical protein [Synechococcales cyanobacterium RM1_1_8]